MQLHVHEFNEGFFVENISFRWSKIELKSEFYLTISNLISKRGL